MDNMYHFQASRLLQATLKVRAAAVKSKGNLQILIGLALSVTECMTGLTLLLHTMISSTTEFMYKSPSLSPAQLVHTISLHNVTTKMSIIAHICPLKRTVIFR